MAQWALQDAKNRFSAVVDAALAGEPQQVTRRGKPAVVVVSVSEYDRLRNHTADNARPSSNTCWLSQKATMSSSLNASR